MPFVTAPPSLQLLPLCALLCLPGGALAAPPAETPVLPQGEYRTTLEEIIVRGRDPYWRERQQPNWRREQPAAPEAPPSRLQWAPGYTREERDDANEMRDPLNPKPRSKLFEMKF